MENKKILFVDDEVDILRSIERAFLEEDFEIYFTKSVDEAIVILDTKDIDILVSDMRMPIKDGVELFKYAKKNYPSIPRIALSAYTDEGQVYRLLDKNLIKLYILKPWKNSEVVDIIKKAIALEEKLNDKRMLTIINNIESLPTLPDIYIKVNNMIETGSGLNDIVEEVSRDQSISSRILRIANSGFYGLKTDSIAQAVSYLGSDILKNIILTTQIFKLSSSDRMYYEMIWGHTEIISENMVKFVKNYLGEKPLPIYLSAALFHDIGMVILIKEFKSKYKQILRTVQEGNGEGKLLELEKENFGMTHQELGGLLLNWWEFPYHIIECLMYHHSPNNEEIINKELVKMLYLCDVYSWKNILKNKKRKIEIDPKVLKDMNLTVEKCDEIFGASTK